MRLALTFGAMAQPLEQQLGYQGFKATQSLLRQWEKDAEAITRLAVRGFLAEGEARKARQRLLKTILRRVERGKV